MRSNRNTYRMMLLTAAVLFFVGGFCPRRVWGASEQSLLSVTEEAQILPMPDGSGKYMLKSDGFYCLNADGTADSTPAVHYFDHFVIDGTVFDGYYYHDESGKFRAQSPSMVYIKELPAAGQTEPGLIFDGCYMVNNLGRLTAAPQIRYMDGLVMNGITFRGYYYFNEHGRMVTDAGIHYLEMDSHGQHFEGYYYFGGENGVLVQEETVTAEGFVVDETGKVENMDESATERLEPQLETLVRGYEGDWSVYVRDLEQGGEILINNRQMSSASLIKAFVMAAVYSNMENITENLAVQMNTTADDGAVTKQLESLLEKMITVSDNESFNELVRLQTSYDGFTVGARMINEYLEDEGYEDTSVLHTLAPSTSTPLGIGEGNTTSVRDCGRLLESIYRGECVSREASEKMLELLLDQQVTTKIPEALEDDVTVANKTGETILAQHDIAIVYGEKTTYILCVMSENCPKEETAVENIQSISRMVYDHLNA